MRLFLSLLFVFMVLVSGCANQTSPFNVTITGALTFETKAVTAGANEYNDYGILALFDVNPDVTRPRATGNFSIYGLQANGVGNYTLSENAGGSTSTIVTFSFIQADNEQTFRYNPDGTFSVTAFDGTTISCTFDFVVENESGEQIHVRGELTDVPFNDEPFTG